MQASDKSLLALIETSKANDTAVAMSLATMSDDPRPDEDKRFALEVAIVLVKAAGYRVSKPRKQKTPKRGPTCVCEFADGTITRMTTFTSLEALDWGRGERLAQAAWGSRWRAKHFKKTGRYPVDAIAPVPPAIIACRFEQDGTVLGTRP
jgi:hypothetical protein